MIKKILTTLFLCCTIILYSFSFLASTTQAAETNNDRSIFKQVCPPNWWVGMKETKLEILLYGADLQSYEVKLTKGGVDLKEVIRPENPNYLILQLEMDSTATAGTALIQFEKYDEEGTAIESHLLPYDFKERQDQETTPAHAGLNPSDLIYLIMPDRFSNGDPSNDVIKEMNQTTLYRDSMFHRHGGDLQGIQQHLDYIESLGVTAIWLNPVQVNDQPKESYHGYAATDHYDIDPRFGGMSAYLDFTRACREKGIKMVMDVIHNHIGNEHFLWTDPPAKDWFHHHDEFTRTHYRATTVFDPYADQEEQRLFKEGWFDHHMPDLNQDQPHLATYLIQNNIWWIETAQLAGFRMDTYAYSDNDFLSKWGRAIFKEYPNFGAFGETWVHGTPTQAYFHGHTILAKRFQSHLPGLTDFQLYYALKSALNEPFGWTEGVARIYYTLAKDYLYTDPSRNVIFLDNHDISRYFSECKEDLNKWKTGLGFLMTTRGTPCIYYGTEILMKNYASLHGGEVREDFPGGWKGDEINKFNRQNLKGQELEAFDYFTKLTNWRKGKKVIHEGKLTHFIPQNGVYVYFRYNEEETVMVVMNTNAETQELDLDKYASFLKGKKGLMEVMSGQKIAIGKTLKVEGMTTGIYEIQ